MQPIIHQSGYQFATNKKTHPTNEVCFCLVNPSGNIISVELMGYTHPTRAYVIRVVMILTNDKTPHYWGVLFCKLAKLDIPLAD